MEDKLRLECKKEDVMKVTKRSKNTLCIILQLLLIAAFLSLSGNLLHADTLQEAAKRGDITTISSLLNEGASPDAKDSDGVTALMYASESGHTDVVVLLLKQGANPNLRDSQYGMNALMLSAAEGHTNIVGLLLEAKSEVNAKDYNLGATALMGAAEYGHTAVIELLIYKGADVNAIDKRGFRALAQAATNGHPETVRLLVTNKADLNAQDDKYGATPLMGAAANGHYPIVEFLLKHGADTTLKSKNGFTALEFALQNGHVKVVDLLKQAKFQSEEIEGRNAPAPPKTGVWIGKPDLSFKITSEGKIIDLVYTVVPGFMGASDCKVILSDIPIKNNKVDYKKWKSQDEEGVYAFHLVGTFTSDTSFEGHCKSAWCTTGNSLLGVGMMGNRELDLSATHSPEKKGERE